jgi:hypothetical protein
LSPILVRPVREQLEHDRVIRLLQAKYKRKFEVAINPGNEQTMPVGTGPSAWFPDLVLQSTERSRKLLGVVEVETAESVNNLEAMSQWAALARLRAPFHLYIPVSSVDSARRLVSEHQIGVAEMWAYAPIGDQFRFTLVHRGAQAGDGKPARAAAASTPRPRASSNGRAATPARTRTTSRPATARATARRPAASAARRKTTAKAKAAAPRRTAAKRARKSAPPSRSSKRR